ncbi:MAG: extracellular solute-binding protein [Chloroflexaceae bacterium]|nr:extracellular solute-binding protein [Chloroflexaceae bacterium]
MTTRQHIVRMLIVCCCMLLVACSVAAPANPPASAPAGTGQPTTAANAPERRPTPLLLWYAWPAPEQRIIATLIDRFNQANPDIQIIGQPRPLASLTRDLLATTPNERPHLVLVKNHNLGALAQAGIVQPLDGLISATDRDQLLSTAVGGGLVRESNGATRLYGLPLAFDTMALYFNKANVLQAPSDTDTLLSRARSFTDTDVKPPIWGLALDGAERWLQWVRDISTDARILARLDSISIQNTLQAQDALMTLDWSHGMAGYRDLWRDNMGVAPLPRLSSTDRAPQPWVQSDSLALSTRPMAESEQQAALQLVRFMLTPESQQTVLDGGKQPTLMSLALDGDSPALAAARAFRDQARQGQPLPNTPDANGTVRDTLQRMQASVVRGLATPADAVTTAEADLRARLKLPPSP